MAAEGNPFPEEDALEDDTEAAIILLLALSIAKAATGNKKGTPFEDIQQKFIDTFSAASVELNMVSKEAIDIGTARITRALKLKDLSIDYSDERFTTALREVFEENVARVLATNREMWAELRNIAYENEWSDEELLRRLNKYYGLTPNHLQTVLNMEAALIADGVKKRKREELVKKRIDKLIDWRMNLIAVQISTGVVEGAKDESFGYLIDTGQIDPNEYEKVWISQIDSVTTDTCINSHNTRAPIGGRFPNGMKNPPNTNVIHPCRSTITLAKRIL